jgi:DHHA2 domain
VCPDTQPRCAQVAELQAEKDLKLAPLDQSSSWPQPGVAFAQLNLKATRKVVQPALAAAFERLARKE